MVNLEHGDRSVDDKSFFRIGMDLFAIGSGRVGVFVLSGATD